MYFFHLVILRFVPNKFFAIKVFAYRTGSYKFANIEVVTLELLKEVHNISVLEQKSSLYECHAFGGRGDYVERP